MVLYQAMDEELRLVYKQIISKLKYLQLRDSDALQLLNSYDYELI
jgi:hypothetical protein